MTRPRNIAVFGSTGSIGCSTLEVVAAAEGRLQVSALTAHSRLKEMCAQAADCRPRWVVATDVEQAAQFDWAALPAGVERLVGAEGVESVARHEAVDIVLVAIVGAAGLRGTWTALEAGKTVALANKETLVMAGPQVMRLARQKKTRLLPVDSEHSAIFQCLDAGPQVTTGWESSNSGRRGDLRRVILTASGGPFRQFSRQQLEQVTVEDALNHPTWDMGPKITVDSATMMNKALEIIEARWLFDLEPEQIEVVIHPQSIVHSMVEFSDGSVLAQLSPPDMKLPIQYALNYPERLPGTSPRMDFSKALQLDFEPPDETRFPALRLGYEVAERGGTSGAVLNAANEAAVAQFLAGQLHFTEIVPACRAVLDNHDFDPSPTLDELLRLDAWAREEVSKWVCT